MKTNLRWSTAAFLMAALSMPLQADEASVGGVKVEIPAPEGFVRMDGINANYDKLTRSSIPASNVLLMFFAKPEDQKNLKGGKFPGQKVNFNVQGIQPANDITAEQFRAVQEMTEKQLAESVEKFKGEIQKLADQAGKTAGELTDTELSLKMGGIVPLGVLGKGDDWLSFGMKMSMEAKGEEGRGKVKATVVVAMVRIGTKLVGLYGTDTTEEEGALEELKKAVFAWKDGVIAANGE